MTLSTICFSACFSTDLEEISSYALVQLSDLFGKVAWTIGCDELEVCIFFNCLHKVKCNWRFIVFFYRLDDRMVSVRAFCWRSGVQILGMLNLTHRDKRFDTASTSKQEATLPWHYVAEIGPANSQHNSLNLNLILFVCLFASSLSCHEKAMVALYFGRIRTRLGVVHFQVLTSYHLICCLFEATKQR